ncbi:carboxypeptidase regulatory-like domain-containing protein [Paractinoplanes atraurantiacus]|uniref:ABC-type multidrug transport system, permease component n=1 Tax=Paractinoplanes atraurantiacus TaxID=1036182 RepID=A0A285IIH4_9ACTN|nr:carboxypeptidase regulatory-like domain-containing protein [Actinoplanes atraurantiacus]SNY47597.1 ABC-type multidrug transport system, permease component [Actinoplanes atraurantiacus]
MSHAIAPQPTRGRVLSLIWFPFFFAAVMSVLYLLAFAHPQPHDMRLGVIGSAPPLPAGLAVQPVTDATAVAHNDLAGAYDSATGTLYISSAASGTRADYLTAVLHPRQTVDVVRLASGDVSGVGVFFYALPLLLIGLITSIVLLQFGMWPLHRKLATIAAAGAFASALAWSVAVSLDVIPADGWLLLYGFALTQAIGWLTTGITRLVKQFFMPVAMTFVLLLGIPTAGATVNADMLPTPLRALHDVLPFGQFIEVVRASAYFDNHGLARPLSILLAWVAAGAALLAWTHRPAPKAQATPAPVIETGHQRLHGTVRTTAGIPVAGATVVSLDDDGRELIRTRTDSSGAYAVDDVRTGLHHLVVTAAHHEPEIVTVAVRGGRIEPARDITVIDWNDPAGNLTAEQISDRRALV